MGYKCKSDYRAESGGIIALIAISIIALLACIALAVDGFFLIGAKLQQDNNAEYAALMALEEFIASRDTVRARERAEAIAGKNFYLTQPTDAPINSGTFVFDDSTNTKGRLTLGNWNPDTGIFDPENGDVNAIQVTLTTSPEGSIKLHFASVVGFQSVGTSSTATAYYDLELEALGDYPFRSVR